MNGLKGYSSPPVVAPCNRKSRVEIWSVWLFSVLEINQWNYESTGS